VWYKWHTWTCVYDGKYNGADKDDNDEYNTPDNTPRCAATAMQQMQYAIIRTSHYKMGMSPDCCCVGLGRTTGFTFRTKDDVLLFTLLKNYQNQKTFFYNFECSAETISPANKSNYYLHFLCVQILMYWTDIKAVTSTNFHILLKCNKQWYNKNNEVLSICCSPFCPTKKIKSIQCHIRYLCHKAQRAQKVVSIDLLRLCFCTILRWSRCKFVVYKVLQQNKNIHLNN